MGHSTVTRTPTVYLWDAGDYEGVSGSLEDAQARAAEHWGDAGHGRVEAAWLVVGAMSEARFHERTGRMWTGCRQPDGTVVWAAAQRERLQKVTHPRRSCSFTPTRWGVRISAMKVVDLT